MVRSRMKMKVSARVMAIRSVLYSFVFLFVALISSPPAMALEVERTSLGDYFSGAENKCKDYDGYDGGSGDGGNDCVCYRNYYIASSSSSKDTEDTECTKLSGLSCLLFYIKDFSFQ